MATSALMMRTTRQYVESEVAEVVVVVVGVWLLVGGVELRTDVLSAELVL